VARISSEERGCVNRLVGFGVRWNRSLRLVLWRLPCGTCRACFLGSCDPGRIQPGVLECFEREDKINAVNMSDLRVLNQGLRCDGNPPTSHEFSLPKIK